MEKENKQKILIIETPFSKTSFAKELFKELEKNGYCLVETKLINDNITGVSLENIIIDDFIKR